MAADADLYEPLRRYWGYDSFRPLQERIVRSLLGGHDTCVVMPTGGGKSLCYQLPALVHSKLAVVVSPLIALMQDQAAQLAQMGIPAAVLNSSLSNSEQSQVMMKARAGEYRLLYLSPERLAREDCIGWLQGAPISFFAIDEAHCISEWGHEFRPEYRQLSRLRNHFPGYPIAAFTASATQRVRHDILHQLKLRDPHKYIASFHRPNLRYVVKQTGGQELLKLLLASVRNYPEGNIIVYAPTIQRVEQTVDFLQENGIAAIAYHGKMEASLRRRNQEMWMSDEVRVLVGTIAFGLGINKANVRAVIHLSLPKSIEQYYQEAGRAGRDGLPADCLLLWQKQDAALLAHFIQQVSDEAEKDRAWQRYHTIRGFADSKRCRHLTICEHFGEKPKWSTCEACDVCTGTPEWLQSVEEYAPPVKRKAAAKVAEISDVDSDLREYLRQWRRDTARENGTPAFVVMHDTSLEEICRRQPMSLGQLLQVSGFGERKTELYGAQIIQALKSFREGARAVQAARPVSRPAMETKRLLDEGETFASIAVIRGRQLATVVNAVSELIESGELEFKPEWVAEDKRAEIEAACGRVGTERLRLIKDAVSADTTFEDIRLVVARLRWEQQSRKRATGS
jgi:ATP-dependent DNA helicase RecQ